MALVIYRVINGKIQEPRVAIGGAEANPRRLAEVEAALDGQSPEASLFTKAAKIAAEMCDPLVDVNNTAEYRRGLVRTMVERALEAAK